MGTHARQSDMIDQMIELTADNATPEATERLSMVRADAKRSTLDEIN